MNHLARRLRAAALALLVLVIAALAAAWLTRPSIAPAAAGDGAARLPKPPTDPYLACAACHGAQGEGLAQTRAPRLAGQDREYLRRQLLAFRAGWRGGSDGAGQQMAAVARSLADDAIDAVLARIATMPSAAHGDRLAGDRWRGEDLYRRLCAVCHGDRAGGAPEHHMARLDHQHGWYLAAQLRLYRSGARGAADEDGEGRAMAFYAGLLPDEAAVDDVVAFITRASYGAAAASAAAHAAGAAQ